MRAMRTAVTFLLLAPATSSQVARAPEGDGGVRIERVLANDNRRSAGRREHGVHRLELEARIGEWHPDGDDAPGAAMAAFAERGKRAQIPGPMVRVAAGTVVEAIVRNALPDTLRVFGLHDRSHSADSAPQTSPPPLTLAPGEIRSVRFTLRAPGSYYYWGTTTNRAINFRTGLDAQLNGAIIVDDARSTSIADRVIVISHWTDTTGRASVERRRMLATVNGRSWPNTERLTYTLGDTIRWRVLNLSADAHPMHLHGFYFRVEARGDGLSERTNGVVEWHPAPVSTDLAVTELMGPGHVVRLAWIPERAGNWLFHCHVPEHFAPRAPLGMPPNEGAHADHAKGGMNGLVLGVTVAERRARVARTAPPERGLPPAPQRLRLQVIVDSASTGAIPRFRYALEGDGRAPATRTTGRAPTLELVRGRAVEVTVVNRMSEPTAVHWHGIELESYYDGVPGFSGAGARTTPLIAPGDSFAVRFTPPRTGTFIYHTHADEARQQRAGLAGPIIVREPDERIDPATDIPIVLGDHVDPTLWNRLAMVNGSTTPDTLRMRVGTRYRLRFVQMAVTWAIVRAELRRDTTLLRWTHVAKDGATVEAHRLQEQPAWLRMGIGEAYDVAITPDRPGPMRIDIRQGTRWGVPSPLVATLPIDVR